MARNCQTGSREEGSFGRHEPGVWNPAIAGAPDSEMASHFCLDPHDPYAQAEALVVFEGEFPAIRLVSVIDKDGDDILSDLVEEQMRDLIREIMEARREPTRSAASAH
ncbi:MULTISPECIES: hypothetical protein [Methylobacterium]|uniref:Uncharacterized protein n=1 Tax=Methylobacterium bullatum TaxID=570505 RepID=A0A679KCZ1_9HYPH|nr:hypothetical protein MBLL_04238 [Methylobacterium bullatum]